MNKHCFSDGTFVVPISSVWLWCMNSVSSCSLTVSTTSLVTAATSRPTDRDSLSNQTNGNCYFLFRFFSRGASFPPHRRRWRAAGSADAAPAGRPSPGRRRTGRWRARRAAGSRSSPRDRSAGRESGGRRRPSGRPRSPPPERERERERERKRDTERERERYFSLDSMSRDLI